MSGTRAIFYLLSRAMAFSQGWYALYAALGFVRHSIFRQTSVINIFEEKEKENLLFSDH